MKNENLGAYSIEDLRKMAKKRLPRCIFEYIDGAAEDADYLTGIDTYDTTGGGGWSTIGGTSFSSPTIAAMFALAGGGHGITYPAVTLYGHNGGSSLYDVTVGGNWEGHTILNRSDTPYDSVDEDHMSECLEVLLQAREGRIRRGRRP